METEDAKTLKPKFYSRKQLHSVLLEGARGNDIATIQDTLLFGAYFDYVENAVDKTPAAYKATFNDFCTRYWSTQPWVPGGLDRDQINGGTLNVALNRLEKHSGDFLFARRYGSGTAAGELVPLWGGKVEALPIERDPAMFTEEGHVLGRWTQIMWLMMRQPERMGARKEHRALLDSFYCRTKVEFDERARSSNERAKNSQLKRLARIQSRLDANREPDEDDIEPPLSPASEG